MDKNDHRHVLDTQRTNRRGDNQLAAKPLVERHVGPAGRPHLREYLTRWNQRRPARTDNHRRLTALDLSADRSQLHRRQALQWIGDHRQRLSLLIHLAFGPSGKGADRRVELRVRSPSIKHSGDAVQLVRPPREGGREQTARRFIVAHRPGVIFAHRLVQLQPHLAALLLTQRHDPEQLVEFSPDRIVPLDVSRKRVQPPGQLLEKQIKRPDRLFALLQGRLIRLDSVLIDHPQIREQRLVIIERSGIGRIDSDGGDSRRRLRETPKHFVDLAAHRAVDIRLDHHDGDRPLALKVGQEYLRLLAQ